MKAIYPGSFDPVTSGHLDIIVRAAALFEHLTVVVAVNSSKGPMFEQDERMELLGLACREIPNVSIRALQDRLLVDYARDAEAHVIIKGLRAVSDFEYEFQMALLNQRLAPEIETMFLMTSSEHSYLSSSIVKEIGRLGGDIRGLVPTAIVERLQLEFRARRALERTQGE